MSLDDLCHSMPLRLAPGVQELSARASLVEDLSNFLADILPGAKIVVFGSSTNGFPFARSDLDLSLDLGPWDVDVVQLAEVLREMPTIRVIKAVDSAKVPIVRFVSASRFRTRRIEGDISVSNALAKVNSQMLRFYTAIDIRVKVLGYMTKLLAKQCNICDASRGNLSSYGYILLLLHFLQRCQPPIIPVLQELHPPGAKPVKTVDGWNAWFFQEPPERLRDVWPLWGHNQNTVSKLWLQFLDFLVYKFNAEDEVICVRRLRPLSKAEKGWLGSSSFAVEDPFDLDHNLGARLSKRKHLYMRDVFRRARDRFASLFDLSATLSIADNEFEALQDYLWDRQYLVGNGMQPREGRRRIRGDPSGRDGHEEDKKLNVIMKSGEEQHLESRDKEEAFIAKATTQPPSVSLRRMKGPFLVITCDGSILTEDHDPTEKANEALRQLRLLGLLPTDNSAYPE